VHLLVAAALIAYVLSADSLHRRPDGTLAMPAFASPPPTTPALTVRLAESATAVAVEAPPPRGCAAPPDQRPAPRRSRLRRGHPETGGEARNVGTSPASRGIVGGMAGGVPGGVAAASLAAWLCPNRTDWSAVVRRRGLQGAAKDPGREARLSSRCLAVARARRRAIEATIGPDGRVQDARVLHSVVPLLDQAAPDAAAVGMNRRC
jgi:hypothetical protein